MPVLQESLDRRAFTNRQRAAEVVGQLQVRIDPEAVIDRGGEVFGRSGIVAGIRGEAVAGTVDDAAANTAVGENRCETTRPMIAAGPATGGDASAPDIATKLLRTLLFPNAR